MTCSRNHCNDEVRPKRLLKSHKKTSYWQVRQKNGAIEAILQPCCPEIQQESSDLSICALIPDGVQKTSSKIKFGNETSSRYHQKCVTKKQKPKFKANPVKRNVITTDTCLNCPGEKKKCAKFKNECYCIQPPNKPVITGGPGCCTVPSPLDDDVNLRRSLDYRPETLKLAKDIIDYIPQSTFLSRIYKENCQRCMCGSCVLKVASGNLKFSERRMNLEKEYHKLAECNRINFDKLSELNCVNVATINISPKTSREFCCDEDESNNNEETNNSKERINSIKSIRKENYFETHTSPKLPPPETHKCVFKFTVDDHGLMQPLNPDAYGINRCSICNKAQPEESPKPPTKTTIPLKPLKIPSQSTKTPPPLKTPVPKTQPPKTQPPKPPKVTQIYHMQQQQVNNFDFAKYNRPLTAGIPLKVCNPSSEKIVQLHVSDPMIFDKNQAKNEPKSRHKCKSPAPVNTWALRYQKGCCYS